MDSLTLRLSVIVLGLGTLNLYSYGQVEHPVNPYPPEEKATSDSLPDSVQNVDKIRDPFWPVGYEPPVPSEAPSAESAAPSETETVDTQPVDFAGLSPEDQLAIKKRMTVGGILQQNQTMIAIINNQLIREGETLELEDGVRTYKFRVKKLTMDRIRLETVE